MKYIIPLLLICGQVLACDCLEKIENLKQCKLLDIVSWLDTPDVKLDSTEYEIRENQYLGQMQAFDDIIEHLSKK